MIDQLRQIAIFASVVDTGSFRGAAAALNLSPSVVSHHISKLEETLGTALLYRSTRSLSLTHEGERLMDSARTMLDAAESGLRNVSGGSRQPSGVLRLTAPAMLAHSFLARELAAFSTDYPKVNLTVDFADSRQDLVGEGYDIAIRVGWLEDSAFLSRKLFEVQRRIVAAPEYLKKRTEPQSPEDLAGWDWIRLAPAQSIRQKFTGPGGTVQSVRMQARTTVNDAFGMYSLARQGAGIGIVPWFLAEEDVQAGRMAHVLPDWKAEKLGVFAVWHPNTAKQGLTRLFLDRLIKAASSQAAAT
ncbi:LysR family transcriptional regulator [Leisingera sp. ANG-Vp]|uniref:LysR family transcriptional regulator n=1 Tax=Leisingera sp. ANG-Vp TaxID=1577896 RepID=UPI00057EA086|nr:LysR family transcriptional regulator [Leisingera sp. ANG-Vp]KIC17520.1 transcriptional regulator [Leisingera sp. ANG-Vp]